MEIHNFKEWMVKSILVRAEHRDDELAKLRKFKKSTIVCNICSIQNTGGYYCRQCHLPTHFSCMIGRICIYCAKQKCSGCEIKYRVNTLRNYYSPCSDNCINKEN